MMKIKKEDIKKIINILKEADKKLKKGEYFSFENNNLTIENFKLPKYWFLNKTNNKYQQQVIYDWMQKQPFGEHWKNLDYAEVYHLVNEDPDSSEKRPCGINQNAEGNKLIYDGWDTGKIEFQLISFEEFLKYVVNEN